MATAAGSPPTIRLPPHRGKAAGVIGWVGAVPEQHLPASSWPPGVDEEPDLLWRPAVARDSGAPSGVAEDAEA